MPEFFIYTQSNKLVKENKISKLSLQFEILYTLSKMPFIKNKRK